MKKKSSSKKVANKPAAKKRKTSNSNPAKKSPAIKKSAGSKQKQFLIATTQGIRIKIQDFLKSVEGAQPGDLRILGYRILERAQKVSEGLKKKK